MDKFQTGQRVSFTGIFDSYVGTDYARVLGSDGGYHKVPVEGLKHADKAPNWNKPTKAQRNATFGKREQPPATVTSSFADAFAQIAKDRPIRP